MNENIFDLIVLLLGLGLVFGGTYLNPANGLLMIGGLLIGAVAVSRRGGGK